MIKFDIQKKIKTGGVTARGTFADVGTGHITAGDGAKMGTACPYHYAEVDAVCGPEDIPGSIFNIPKDVTFDEVAGKLKGYGMSDAFIAIFKEAYDQHFDKIIFDRDGPVYDELEQFDW